ncbi:MAG: TlpA family protein disulfide reductase [Candidatus Methylomirabilis sp.]
MRRSLRQPHAAFWIQITVAWLATFLIGAITYSAAQAAPVPDFTLHLLDGKTTSLKANRGKPLLVNFFHSK